MEPDSKGPVPQDGMVIAAGTVRGTQSFVHTLSECWRRPSLTALEVLWRWAYGVPALLVLRYQGLKILQATAAGLWTRLRNMTVLDPMGVCGDRWAKAYGRLLLPPDVERGVVAGAGDGGGVGGGVGGGADGGAAAGGWAAACAE